MKEPVAEGRWICAQLGAREHFAVPKALDSVGCLEALITDMWSKEGISRLLARYSKRLSGRSDREIPNSRVQAGNASWLLRELWMRASHSSASSRWNLIMQRNEMFDAMTRRRLDELIPRLPAHDLRRLHFFAYSYAATLAIQKIRALGAHAVLGQIDGGPFAEQILLREKASYPGLEEQCGAAPKRYWDEWRLQCDSASRIVVNSPWAAHCLDQVGIPKSKVVVVPLFFRAPISALASGARRKFLEKYDTQRPLRVLFLGQLNLQKGVGRLFDAIALLKGEPIEFWFVGSASVSIPSEIAHSRSVRLFGPVSRGNVESYYRESDVFILPTLSDGFAITQLEAQAYGLPVIASRFCGAVVSHRVNGIILNEVSPAEIADTLRNLVKDAALVERMAENTIRTFDDLPTYGRRFVKAAAC